MTSGIERKIAAAVFVLTAGLFVTEPAAASFNERNLGDRVCKVHLSPGQSATCGEKVRAPKTKYVGVKPWKYVYHLKCARDVKLNNGNWVQMFFKPSSVTGYRALVRYKKGAKTMWRGCREEGWDDTNKSLTFACYNNVASQELNTVATVTCTNSQ